MTSFLTLNQFNYMIVNKFINRTRSKITLLRNWFGGGDLPTFNAESKSAKIPNSLYGWGDGCYLPTFDAESKCAKIPNSLYGWEGGGGVTFQLLMWSPNPLRSQIPPPPSPIGGGVVWCLTMWDIWWEFGVNYKILTRFFSTQSEWVHHS